MEEKLLEHRLALIGPTNG